MSYEHQFVRLRLYNVFMGFLHLAQAAAVFILSNDFTLPITTSFVKYMPEMGKLWPVTETAVNLPLGPMVAIFLLMSAIAHFTVSSPGVFDKYVNNLKKGINYARWFEYAFSASWMIVIIVSLVAYLAYRKRSILPGKLQNLVEMTVERFFPALYFSLGIFLPLITVNCAIFGASLFMVIRKYDFVQSLAYGAGSGIGWMIAIIAVGAIREKLQKTARLPKGLEGPAITLFITGIMALAFMAFSGMIQIQ